MANLTRWEPMREFLTLRDMMDRLFEDNFTRSLQGVDRIGSPMVDMYQTNDEVVIKATLPGMKAEDVQISVVGDMVTLQGEIKKEEEVKNLTYHLQERSYGMFSRSIPLPTAVVTDKAKAEFENGILTLTLPKAEEVKPKTITIKAK